MKTFALVILVLLFNSAAAVTAKEQLAMHSPRSAHTVTLLDNGDALIAGGMHVLQQATATTEIYHARSGKFSQGPQLPIPLQSHSANKLANGAVLLVGGYDGSKVRDEVYLFQPNSQRFIKLGKLSSPRMSHSSAVLPNGNLLVIGGYSKDMQVLDSAEIFDLRTLTSQIVTATMSVPRLSHSSLVLDDGRVAIIGGHQGKGSQTKVHSSIEYFDPATGKFELGGQMQFPRHKHDSLLLPDGSILVVAGSNKQDWRGRYNHAEIYDTKSDISTQLIQLNQPRFKIRDTAILLDNGQVLLTAGARQAELVDIKNGTARMLPFNFGQDLAFARALKLLDGSVLVTGGYDSKMKITNSSWKLDLAALAR